MPYPTKKLGEVCETFTDGDWIESKDQSSSGIRLIQTGNIGQGIFLNKAGKSRFISEQTFKRLNCTEIFPGDLLISRLPDPVGRSCIIPETDTRMITAVDCTIVRVNEKKILREFLLLYTNSSSYDTQIREHLSGTTRQRISRGNLAEIQIPLPPIGEQRKIVAKLERVLGKIKEAKKLRAEAESAAAALLPAELHKIFSEGKKNGWEEKELGDIIDFFNGKAHEPFISPHGKFKVINSKFISRAGAIYKKTNNQLSPLFKNDVVMVMSDVPNGKALAKCYLVETDDVYTLNQRIGCFRVKDTNIIDPRYLLIRLNRNEQLLAYDKGRGQTNLRKNDILEIKILLPPIAEQKKIVARLDALSAKVQNLRQAQFKTASDFTALEQSVLHQAFNI